VNEPDEEPQADGEPSLFQELIEEAQDDRAICDQLLERFDVTLGDTRPWERISSTAESVTVALDVRVGSLVRVISWDLDGHFHMTTTWCHGVTLEDLRGARGRGRS